MKIDKRCYAPDTGETDRTSNRNMRKNQVEKDPSPMDDGKQFDAAFIEGGSKTLAASGGMPVFRQDERAEASDRNMRDETQKVRAEKPARHRAEFRWYNFAFLIIAGCVNATGAILLLYPAQLIDSGISGLSMVLANKTGFAVSIFLVAINLPLFLIGLKKMGLPFIVYSLTAIGAYALAAFLFQYFHVDATLHDLIGNDRFIACVFGGLLSGVGSGLTIRFGGAIDGIEVLAVMFAKKIGVSVGQFVMAFNMIVYIAGGILFQNLIICLYSVVSYVVGLKVVDFVVDGFDKGKACFIVTRDAEKLARAISLRMGRGITEIDCRGYYLKEDNKLLYCVVNRFEITQLKNVIAEVDPDAFVSVNEVSEVTGNRIKFAPRRRSVSLASEEVRVETVADTRSEYHIPDGSGSCDEEWDQN